MSMEICAPLPVPAVAQDLHTLAALPNEMLVRIFSCLDPCSLISVRITCRRFWQILSDPICWPTSLFWRGSGCIKDIDRLKLVLQLSRITLRQFSLSCLGYHYPLSKYVDCIQSCRYLESISLANVDCSKAQLEKILRIPSLTHLRVDVTEKLLKDIEVIFEAITASRDCKLKTLTLKEYMNSLYDLMHYVKAWTKFQCNPPQLRLVTSVPRQMFSGFHVHNILSLHPSIQHRAYLSLYEFTADHFTPLHPFLQFNFTPLPSLLLANFHSEALVLTSDQPDSEEFSCAVFDQYSSRQFKGSFEFVDICHTLQSIILSDFDLHSSSLAELAELCPNLLHLDLQHSSDILLDLKGLTAVATCCLKLRVLTLTVCMQVSGGNSRARVGSLEELWEILRSISSLRVLSIPGYLCGGKSQSNISMPKLTDLRIDGCWHDVKSAFGFLTRIPSLRVFMCEHLPPASLCRGISNFLSASPNLTHLYISKELGNKLTLPADPSCYQHLQKFLLECFDFIVHEDLASALAQSKDLSVLVFRVDSVAIRGIAKLANSLMALSLFHIYTTSSSGFHKTRKTEPGIRVSAFTKSLKETAKQAGRIIDLKISINQKFTRQQCPELFKWFPQ